MISMLWKEACSGSLHDLAHISIQNCLADCLTKASAQADNLITAVKIGRILDVEFHLNFRTLMEHKAFLSTCCRTFMQKKEQNVFFLNALRISLSPRAKRKKPSFSPPQKVPEKWYQQDDEFQRSAVLVKFACGQTKESIKTFCGVTWPDVDAGSCEMKC